MADIEVGFAVVAVAGDGVAVAVAVQDSTGTTGGTGLSHARISSCLIALATTVTIVNSHTTRQCGMPALCVTITRTQDSVNTVAIAGVDTMQHRRMLHHSKEPQCNRKLMQQVPALCQRGKRVMSALMAMLARTVPMQTAALHYQTLTHRSGKSVMSQ